MTLGDESERRQYRLLYLLGIGVFTVATLAERAMFWRDSSRTGSSVIERAKATTERSIPFAFMGW